jgi:hypothetical protein
MLQQHGCAKRCEKERKNSFLLNKRQQHNRLDAVENRVGNAGNAPNVGVD